MKTYTSLVLCVLFTIASIAQEQWKPEDLQKFEGFFNFWHSEKQGKIFLEVAETDTDFLYVHYLRTGLGSNDIGLDRGQLGGSKLLRFEKAGNKLLLVQPNLSYRAETENVLERQSVQEAFAHSVLHAFDIEGVEDGSYIIDFTSFLMKDANGVGGRLRRGGYGNYTLNKDKNALMMERSKAFPQNVELETRLTFEGQPTGRALWNVAPDAQNLSLIQHHSFVKLPDDGYKKRQFDPRSGSFSISYMDYATEVFEPITKRFITRHRLEKEDPEAAVSPAVEPIVYYLDPGTPEPVRSALLDGARWWNEAFEAIGYKDALQVKMLPEDADPLDIRYNVIQWVHRSTRGWSYGASVTDPRTGEIIKGHVSLGSLRIRQDLMIAQALMNRPFAQRDDNHQAQMEMAVARIRQLSAHELGHTLGFAHNFAASVIPNASVMDYPHPKFTLENGVIDFSQAYETGIGDWDKMTVKYSYGAVPTGVDEDDYLKGVLKEAQEKGLQFISDSDARAAGGAHADAHLWDNGANATQELMRVMELRAHAIQNFSVDNIRTGEPYSVLEDVFVPLYFFHRYQTEAAVKTIGGLNYSYAVKGDSQPVVQTTDSEAQVLALRAILEVLSPQALAIPKEKLALFPPRAYGYGRSRESFKSNTGVAFDALGAPATVAQQTLELLLNPQRAARLVQQKAVNESQLGLQDVLKDLIAHTIYQIPEDSYLQEVSNTVKYEVLREILSLAVSPAATSQVTAIVMEQIDALQHWLDQNKNQDTVTYSQLSREIERFKQRPEEWKPKSYAPEIPDGAPIGLGTLNNR